MATAADPNTAPPPSNVPPPNLSALTSTATAMVVALVWGAAMLAIFGLWMRSKYEGDRPIVTNIFFVGALAAAALAAWQAFTLWFKKETPEQKATGLQQQQGLMSYAFIGAGFGLIVFAFVLGVDKDAAGNYPFRRENFAETFGSLLFGMIALAGGYFLQQPEGVQTSPIQFLLDKLQAIKLGLVILAGVSLFTFGYLFYNYGPMANEERRVEFGAYFPEYASLLFTSMLCIGCVLWLNTGNFDEFGVRLFVLVFGGALGLILFFETLGRAWIWRQDIFLGGTAAWQGEGAWHFWLCAYVMFVSLVLMFLSFNLAKADIRRNVALRRVMYGYDTIVQALLLMGILAILNVVIYVLMPFSWDWTSSRGAYALAESSKNLIAKLPNEANLIVLMSSSSPLYKDTRNLLDNCEAIGNKLKVKYLSPDANPVEVETLARSFPVIDPEQGGGRGVLIVYGAMPSPSDKEHNTPNTFIPEGKLAESARPRSRDEKPKYSFKGEAEIIRELKFLVDKKKKRIIYFVQGETEPDIKNRNLKQRMELSNGFKGIGLGVLIDNLTAENFDIFGLNFGVESPAAKTPPDIKFAKEGPDKKKIIPDDCDTLIVAGVSTELKPEVVDAIDRYMDRKGSKMLVYLDVVADEKYASLINTGLEPMLKRFGVEVKDEFILQVPTRIPDPTMFVATGAKSEHPLAAKFLKRPVWVKRSARVIRPTDSRQFKAETILQLDVPGPGAVAGQVILEKDVSVLKDEGRFIDVMRDNPAKRILKEAREPVPVGIAVKEVIPDPLGKEPDTVKPRLVVFGDTEFITNLELEYSPTKRINYSLTVSSLEWMAEREAIGILPKDHKVFTLDMNVEMARMILLPGWLSTLALLVMGVSIWVVRRR